jgi:DNA-binding transcriptional MerR regulator
MNLPRRNLSPSQAAVYLGVSPKALRLYEQRGLIAPGRSAAGWRLYSTEDLARAMEIVSLRTLGLSLGQVARAMEGDPSALEAGLAAHEEQLRQQAKKIDTALQNLRSLRDDIRRGQAPDSTLLHAALGQEAGLAVGFELPWPWDGEWFELRDVPPLNFITGPLGSGKTRFAERLAAELPNGSFLSVDRLNDKAVGARLDDDTVLSGRVECALGWLEDEGAIRTEALLALLVALETDAPTKLVIDMAEAGLCETTQHALIAYLRLKARTNYPLFLMTRSSSILELDLVGSREAVIYCPANHSPPFRIHPYPGGRGYEAVATCLAAPDVRKRTEGIIAIQPGAVA